jgi:hypothetical protein
MLICFHSFITVETLLPSLSIVGYYYGRRTLIAWDVFTEAPIIDVFWEFYRVAVFRT